MSTIATRDFRWIAATLSATVVSAVGTLVAAVLHAQIGQSVPLAVLIAISFLASLGSAIGALLLAGWRRNVLWLIALAVSMTALMGLLATVVSSLGTN